MLYDPKWEAKQKDAEVKVDPFKLSTLISWLEKQRSDKPYCYLNCYECMLSQYFNDHGYTMKTRGGPWVVTAIDLANFGEGIFISLPPGFDKIACGSGKHQTSEHTFGQALARALAA